MIGEQRPRLFAQLHSARTREVASARFEARATFRRYSCEILSLSSILCGPGVHSAVSLLTTSRLPAAGPCRAIESAQV